MAAPAQVLIGQLTDTHVLAVDDTTTEVFVDNNDRLADAVSSLVAESPRLDVVVATGDLVDDARAEQYLALVDLLAPLDVPLLVLPGNHDDRDLLRSSFPATPWIDADHASWVYTVGGVRLVGLDSTTPGHHGGVVDGARVAWLDGVLAEPHDGATIVAMHHPPFRTGIEWMERSGFVGLDDLERVLAAHRVERVVCGHLHRPIVSSVAGTTVQVGMSTVQHVQLDLGDGEPAVIDDPIGYQIHRVVGRDVVGHARFVRTGSPITPSWADEMG